MSTAERTGDPQYSVVAGDVRRDRDDVMTIWHGNLGTGERFGAKYDWFYLSCPWGDPELQLLRHEPTRQYVGAATIGPRRMLWQGREIRAGVLVDLVVNAQHRSLGPALMLQRSVLERAMHSFDMVYGFPNPRALPVVRRAGYTRLADMERWSRVLRHAPYLERLMPRALARPLGALLDAFDRGADVFRRLWRGRLAVEWRDRFDSRMQALWERSRPGDGLVSVRDAAALRWRFEQVAFNRARYLLVGAQEGGPIDAWFACQREGSTLHVRDFWSADAPRGAPLDAIDALVRAARCEGCRVVSMQYAGPREAFAPWRAAGFVAREQRPIVGAWREELRDRAGATPVHLSPADEDE